MSYLKYYFGYKNDELYLDSVVDSEPVPEDFLKWYEEGDFKPLDKEVVELASKMGTPLFAAVFAPRGVNFSVQDLLAQKEKE